MRNGIGEEYMGYGYSGFSMGFQLMSIIVPMIFIIVIGVFIVTFIKGVSTWNKNNQSPKLIVDAKVISKRTDVSHSHHANAGDVTGAHGFSSSSSTWYYTTFQVESGDRVEFSVSGSEYGMLAEGDQGKLSFQGTRYLSFQRNESNYMGR